MLNTTKILKLNFITFLFMISFHILFGLEVQDQGINLSSSSTLQNWTITQYYPGKIIIIRSSSDNSGSVSFNLSGNLIKVNNNELIDTHVAFRYSVIESNGITGNFTSVSSSGDISKANEPKINDGNIEFSLDQTVIYNSIYISGLLHIDVPLTLEDGTYNLNCQLIAIPGEYGPSFSNQNLPIEIVTTPVVQVDDIDFGRQIKGVGTVTRTSNITVTGKEGAELTYSLDTSGEFILTGGGSTIPFTSEITTSGDPIITNGESTATLQVTTNISSEVAPGKYTGSIRVLVQHN